MVQDRVALTVIPVGHAKIDQDRGSCDPMSGDSVSDLAFIEEAMRVAQAAKEQNLVLRTMGATAIRIHCPEFAPLHERLGRPITDLDFIGLSKERNRLIKILEDTGFVMDRDARYRMAVVGRCVLQKRDSPLHADLFFDRLEWNHTLDLRDRLRLDFPTITISDLLFEKMQIVRINEKDIKDAVVMLREHPIADRDNECVNGSYVADILAADWGFYYTFTTNLSKVETFTQKYEQLSQEDRKDVTSKIASLRQMIEEKPKSLGWKLRARTGTSAKWYREVDEFT